MNNYENFYNVLQVPVNSTQQQIKSSYKKLILDNHPDRSGEPKTGEKCALIDQAWKVLRDPQSRKIYDAELMQNELQEQPIILKKVAFKEFTLSNDNMSLPCRCGGSFVWPTAAEIKTIEDEFFYISCDECSLHVECCKNDNLIPQPMKELGA